MKYEAIRVEKPSKDQLIPEHYMRLKHHDRYCYSSFTPFFILVTILYYINSILFRYNIYYCDYVIVSLVRYDWNCTKL